MKTELKSQFQLVSLRLLIRLTNCLNIYLKNCDFLRQSEVFLRFGVRPNRFGQNRPKVRPNCSVRSFTSCNESLNCTVLSEWRRQNLLSWSNVRRPFCDFHYLLYHSCFKTITTMWLCRCAKVGTAAITKKLETKKFAIQFFVMFLVL